MRSALIHRFSGRGRFLAACRGEMFAVPRRTSVALAHLAVMDSEQLSGLGLEPMVTTSELAEYLRVDVQAIYDLRLHDRGPKGVRVGRELRFRISDVKRWLDGMHEPKAHQLASGGER